MFKLFGLLFLFLFTVVGILLMIGTYKKWPILVDPPQEFYSQYMLKKIFGSKFIVIFNYFMGVLFIVLSLIAILNGLLQK